MQISVVATSSVPGKISVWRPVMGKSEDESSRAATCMVAFPSAGAIAASTSRTAGVLLKRARNSWAASAGGSKSTTSACGKQALQKKRELPPVRTDINDLSDIQPRERATMLNRSGNTMQQPATPLAFGQQTQEFAYFERNITHNYDIKCL